MLVHMDSPSTPSDGIVLRRLRTALLALMVFGMVGKYVGEKETERLWRYVVID